MNIELNNDTKHLLILGAGASVDYGLPLWKQLGQLIKLKINSDKNGQYQYHKEILEWIDKVGEIGEKGKYGTIDECIAEESDRYHSGGDKIENQIFLIMKDILTDSYKKNDDGWIKLLNEKILQKDGLENQFAFVNYNYDDVLSRNFLKFVHLSDKKLLVHKPRLSYLAGITSLAVHPNGYSSHDEEVDENSQIYVKSNTIKSDESEYINMISCHDSKDHSVYKNNRVAGIKLYIIGLGGGLKFNLEKLNFLSPVSELHITIKDSSKEDEVVKFLIEKFGGTLKEEIKIYSDCNDLIERCF